MNVIQALGVENSRQARALLAARDLRGCRVYGGRLVHIRREEIGRSLCGKYLSTTSRVRGWSFTDNCCRRCAEMTRALAVTDD